MLDSARQRHKVALSVDVVLVDRYDDRLVAETGLSSHEHSRDDVVRCQHHRMTDCTPAIHPPPTYIDPQNNSAHLAYSKHLIHAIKTKSVFQSQRLVCK